MRLGHQRLADLLAGGPRSSAEIARETGADRESIYRLMRYLSGLGVFEQTARDSFALGELGTLLRTGVQDSARGMALWYGEVLWPVPGLGVGYLDVKIVECHHLLNAIATKTPATPSFADGYRIAAVCDAVLASGQRRSWVEVNG